jgi:dTMP kinase
MGTDRLESESRSFHDRVRYAFLDLAAADPKRYLVLDAARPADEIGDAVTARLKALLTTGDETHPPDASTTVPPGPDLQAPDLTPDPYDAAPAYSPSSRRADRVATDERITHPDTVTDVESPFEVMTDLTEPPTNEDPAAPDGNDHRSSPRR